MIAATALGACILAASPAPPTGAPAQDGDPRIRVECARDEVEFGVPVGLLVVRSWRDGWIPDPWDPAALAPLTLVQDGSERRQEGDRWIESLSLRAFAFTLEDVEVPALRLRVSRGAHSDEAFGPSFTLRVRPAVDPENPGELEPPELLRVPGREVGASALAWMLGLAVLAAGGVLAWRSGRLPLVRVGAAERARAQLLRLREAGAGDPDGRRRLAVAAAQVVREYLEEARGLPATRRTTPQILQLGERSLPSEEARRALAELLALADEVKFGAREPAAADCERELEEAARTVDLWPVEEGT